MDVFIHIPKCGGSTLNRVLKNEYKKENIHLKVYDQLAEENFGSEIGLDEKRLLHGHFSYGIHEKMKLSSIPRYFSMLRDPVDRIISHYFYVKSSPTHYLYDSVKNSHLSLLDYALSDLSFELDNGQVRMIAGVGENTKTVTEKHLEKAIYNIDNHFASIGILEEYDLSILLFKNKLNWSRLPIYKKVNVTKPNSLREEIDLNVKKQIRDRNKFDQILYDYVRERILREGKDFDRHKIKQRLFNILLKTTNTFL